MSCDVLNKSGPTMPLTGLKCRLAAQAVPDSAALVAAPALQQSA